MEEITVAKRALELIQGVNPEDFIEEVFTDKISKCCVIGHYCRLTSENPSDFSIDNCTRDGFGSWGRTDLQKAAKSFLKVRELPVDKIEEINNDATEEYPEATIKERVVHFLSDMVAAGY